MSSKCSFKHCLYRLDGPGRCSFTAKTRVQIPLKVYNLNELTSWSALFSNFFSNPVFCMQKGRFRATVGIAQFGLER